MSAFLLNIAVKMGIKIHNFTPKTIQCLIGIF
jgi:hypothetical protein